MKDDLIPLVVLIRSEINLLGEAADMKFNCRHTMRELSEVAIEHLWEFREYGTCLEHLDKIQLYLFGTPYGTEGRIRIFDLMESLKIKFKDCKPCPRLERMKNSGKLY